MNSAGWRDGQQMSGVEEFRLDGMWSDMRHATRAFEGLQTVSTVVMLVVRKVSYSACPAQASGNVAELGCVTIRSEQPFDRWHGGMARWCDFRLQHLALFAGSPRVS